MAGPIWNFSIGHSASGWVISFIAQTESGNAWKDEGKRVVLSEAWSNGVTADGLKPCTDRYPKRRNYRWAFCSILIIAVSFLWTTRPAFGLPQDPVPGLLAQLNDRDPAAKLNAIHRLVQLHEKRAVESLIDPLSHDPNPEVRRGAAYALGQLGDPRAIQPLIASLKDENPDVCVNSIFAVTRVGGTERVSALIAALAHKDLHVCRAAAVGLVLLGDRNAVQPLIRSLDDTRLTVRSGAAYALGFLGDRRAVTALLRTLDDDRPLVRLTAIGALDLLGDARSVPALRQLASQDPDLQVRLRAAEALNKLETPPERPPVP